MAWTLKLDELTHDLTLGSDGKFPLVSGADEVRQRIKVTLWHHQGEYFLNTGDGVPWHDNILGSKNRDGEVSLLLRREILSVPGVVSLDSFGLNKDFIDRRYNFQAACTVQGGNDGGSEITLNLEQAS